MKNGGYAIISYDDVNIFNKIDSAYKAGKPILFYDDDKTCFYVDSVKVNGDGDYEFTKGGKTWTVTDNNILSSEGNLQNHLYRFIINDVLIYAGGNELRGSLNIVTNYDITNEWKALSDYTSKEDLFTKLYNFIKKNGSITLNVNADSSDSAFNITVSISDNTMFAEFMSISNGASNVEINTTTINDSDTSTFDYITDKIQLF